MKIEALSIFRMNGKIEALSTFWMSFCDSNKQSGQQFLGVIIGQGTNLRDAVIRTHKIGINPGGEIISCKFDDGKVKHEHLDRLLTKAQLIEYGYIF